MDFDGSADVYLPVSAGYVATQTYAPGDLLKVDGDWYEAYHPDGCLGKDPRDSTNRPSGWTETDVSKPYYWLKIGPWLSLPETGSPIYLPSVTLREGLIKYRNDGSLHKSKFWRLAQLYPNLVSGNYIQIADLRGEFLRGLDDGRGVDASRVINSLEVAYAGSVMVQTSTLATTTSAAGTPMLDWINFTGANGAFMFNDGAPSAENRVDITSGDNRPRNVAMLIATRI